MKTGRPGPRFNPTTHGERRGWLVFRAVHRSFGRLQRIPWPDPCLFCGAAVVAIIDTRLAAIAARVIDIELIPPEQRESLILDPVPEDLIALRCRECNVAMYAPRDSAFVKTRGVE